ncbi:Glycosyltransferase involved in cell wall bisynthesis [Arthrobacter sp. OV608]|nr:Glycosyltransferase involved in cell wall bisynthesis [Arthrobacter sp. OV608]
MPLSGRWDFDVLHFPADTGAVSKGRRPIVGTIHGLATLHVPNVRKGIHDKLWRTRVGRLADVSTRIITVSNSSARDIATLFPGTSSKIVPILHGIDHEKFNIHAGRELDTEAVAELGVDGPYFLYLGNLDPRKNIVELVRAATLVYEETGVPLLIAGGRAWDSDSILACIEESLGVTYLGRVDERYLVPLMRQALAFCFPSKYEGFGFPVVEAMACGTPVICSNRGSLAEVAGDAAMVLDNIDYQSIKGAMLEMAANSSLRDDLRTRGLVNSLRFDWAKSVEQHAQVFHEVAN